MTEDVSRGPMRAEGAVPQFKKRVSLVFSDAALAGHHAEINEQLKNVLLRVETETELVQKDNLARGDLIDSAQVRCIYRKNDNVDTGWWSIKRKPH
jgi:hypothetical protein